MGRKRTMSDRSMAGEVLRFNSSERWRRYLLITARR